ncbi:SGNH/GDSL hydrolase family protein [Aerophototrophica crusticola]|uniref:SGNH/GDSL hydrolase family protein n=1 Tax=Aerophototrophica crusticola TaxID=1709002 RepID=A0A858RCK0_9PROT|nr:SGNH/GDSL hydrolase family protein [Rhodospirillaceae bacterium B3]
MGHVVLLGDSIFDNGAYVAGGPDVGRQLGACLPAGWRATLAAVDGAVAAGVAAQLPRIPADATHLAVSAGGNDALRQASILEQPARSVAEAVLALADARDRFAADYHAMLDAVLARRLPTALCTIYDARFPDPVQHRLVGAGLALFNDVITRAAFTRGLALVDLRLLCGDDADYANPIEPSTTGGAKIAAALAHWATGPYGSPDTLRPQDQPHPSPVFAHGKGGIPSDAGHQKP